MHLRPMLSFSKDEHGAIVVTIRAVTVDPTGQLVRGPDGVPVSALTESFRIFESGFGKSYVSSLAFDSATEFPAIVIDQAGNRHFHAKAEGDLFGAQGGEIGMKVVKPHGAPGQGG